MPLSENEEQILAEIERQLAAEDPRFVARARRRRLSRSMSRTVKIRASIVLALVGLASVLSLGFIEGTGGTVAGAIGMVLVFGAILLGASVLTEKPERQHSSVPPDERT
jgi:protein-S-isoprenylcysteine O-methyltransferase Ste14